MFIVRHRKFFYSLSALLVALSLTFLFVWGLSRWVKPGYLIAGAVGLNLIGLYSLYQYFGWVWGS